jgi:hypothetical protein
MRERALTNWPACHCLTPQSRSSVSSLRAVDDLNPEALELVSVVGGLPDLTTGEARDVEYQDVPPGPARCGGIREHALEPVTALDARPGDGVVDVLTDDLKAVLGGVAMEVAPLVGDRLLLPIGRAPQVEHGRLAGGCSLGLGSHGVLGTSGRQECPGAADKSRLLRPSSWARTSQRARRRRAPALIVDGPTSGVSSPHGTDNRSFLWPFGLRH